MGPDTYEILSPYKIERDRCLLWTFFSYTFGVADDSVSLFALCVNVCLICAVT